jgi:hypothetical protein
LYQASIKQRSERQKQRNTAIENSKIARVNALLDTNQLVSVQ